MDGVDLMDEMDGTDCARFGLALAPTLAADSVKAFGEAAFVHECFFLAGDLAVQQAAGDTDQNQRGVGGNFGIGGFAMDNGRCGLDGRHGLF